MEEEDLSLMRGLLEMDPSKRLTSYNAIMHPYFDSIRDMECFNDNVILKQSSMNQYRAMSPESSIYGKNLVKPVF
jgi:hypothetical protein